tara:strand:- start:45 stop:167 length:123 start_codon:yes stop_codon:yes gene_type:complete
MILTGGGQPSWAIAGFDRFLALKLHQIPDHFHILIVIFHD